LGKFFDLCFSPFPSDMVEHGSTFKRNYVTEDNKYRLMTAEENNKVTLLLFLFNFFLLVLDNKRKYSTPVL
jgi:hypothetical protein